MKRTPYSPFVEKETAPVLWYVRVASLLLRFSGIVRRVWVRPDRGWLTHPRPARRGAWGGHLDLREKVAGERRDLRRPIRSSGCRHSGHTQFRPKPSDMSICRRQDVSTWESPARRIVAAEISFAIYGERGIVDL